uniref:Sec-independent periplasmic protein translocase n=1 Tax=Desmarestia aculeata TaxID=62298 RepID=UPI002E77CAE2|nr:Sec-independent periplasmic protein translocase [Desmarestia aculeata]WAM62897.1 Sec-independent periplasmic protein translocase [Desmarestia aculeata]
MITEYKTLNFKFCSFIKVIETGRSTTELYFNEHFDEVRQRFFHLLGFLCLVTLLTLYNVKSVVKILEGPVSNIQFFQLSPGEYFFSTLVISLYNGVLFSTPLLLGQALFFSYFILIPAALNFFIFYGSEVIEPFWSFSQYFNFVSALFFSTGLVFQVPIVQIILSLAKLIDPIKMLNYWRPMILLSTVLGAILTPSADPITQLLLSGALFFLYFLGSLISINLTKKEVTIV